MYQPAEKTTPNVQFEQFERALQKHKRRKLQKYILKSKTHVLTLVKPKLLGAGCTIGLEFDRSEHKIDALLSWSSGKDSSLSLYELQANNAYRNFRIVSLVTTLTQDYERVSMHGIRRDLLVAQSTHIGIDLEEVWIPKNASNETYQYQLAKSLSKWGERGVSTVIFGDLFLEDVRAYREKFLDSVGFRCAFPIWHKDTRKLAEWFINEGFKATICTVDPHKLDPKFCGREFNEAFLSEISPEIDPCGENGEFHTFVYGGPIFSSELNVKVREVVMRDGFYFADLLLA